MTIDICHSGECWVELFGGVGFTGVSRRFIGPASYTNLAAPGDRPGAPLASFVVGPGAFLKCFARGRESDTAVWFSPGQRVPDVAALRGDAAPDCIQILDRPPARYEPDHAAFVRHLTPDLAGRGAENPGGFGAGES